MLVLLVGVLAISSPAEAAVRRRKRKAVGTQHYAAALQKCQADVEGKEECKVGGRALGGASGSPPPTAPGQPLTQGSSALQNCVLKCISSSCYLRIFGADPVEEGEVRFLATQARVETWPPQTPPIPLG